jgi:hypothetical protein
MSWGMRHGDYLGQVRMADTMILAPGEDGI